MTLTNHAFRASLFGWQIWPLAGTASLTIAWTIFVWGSRLRNIAVDSALSTAAKTRGSIVAGVFVVAALGFLAHLMARRPALRRVAAAFAWWTVGWWSVRVFLILGHDHSVAFTVVHLVLAAVSAALAIGAWAVLRIRPDPQS